MAKKILDEVTLRAIVHIVKTNQGTSSIIQRKLGVDFKKASEIIDFLESLKIVGGNDGSSARKVLVNEDTVVEILDEEFSNFSFEVFKRLLSGGEIETNPVLIGMDLSAVKSILGKEIGKGINFLTFNSNKKDFQTVKIYLDENGKVKNISYCE